MNVEIIGDTHQKKNVGFQYDCDFNGRLFLSNGKEFNLPKGRYKVSS